jgi:hypothetical protein
LVDLVQLPLGVNKRPLGDLRLRGKDSEIVLYALEKQTGGQAARRRVMALEQDPIRPPISSSHRTSGGQGSRTSLARLWVPAFAGVTVQCGREPP